MSQINQALLVRVLDGDHEALYLFDKALELPVSRRGPGVTLGVFMGRSFISRGIYVPPNQTQQQAIRAVLRGWGMSVPAGLFVHKTDAEWTVHSSHGARVCRLVVSNDRQKFLVYSHDRVPWLPPRFLDECRDRARLCAASSGAPVFTGHVTPSGDFHWEPDRGSSLIAEPKPGFVCEVIEERPTGLFRLRQTYQQEGRFDRHLVEVGSHVMGDLFWNFTNVNNPVVRTQMSPLEVLQFRVSQQNEPWDSVDWSSTVRRHWRL